MPDTIEVGTVGFIFICLWAFIGLWHFLGIPPIKEWFKEQK